MLAKFLNQQHWGTITTGEVIPTPSDTVPLNLEEFPPEVGTDNNLTVTELATSAIIPVLETTTPIIAIEQLLRSCLHMGTKSIEKVQQAYDLMRAHNIIYLPKVVVAFVYHPLLLNKVLQDPFIVDDTDMAEMIALCIEQEPHETFGHSSLIFILSSLHHRHIAIKLLPALKPIDKTLLQMATASNAIDPYYAGGITQYHYPVTDTMTYRDVCHLLHYGTRENLLQLSEILYDCKQYEQLRAVADFLYLPEHISDETILEVLYNKIWAPE